MFKLPPVVSAPAGNRVELANAGARLILAPDWKPVVWTEAERRTGQACGLKTIESFHTHGTPPVDRETGDGRRLSGCSWDRSGAVDLILPWGGTRDCEA